MLKKLLTKLKIMSTLPHEHKWRVAEAKVVRPTKLDTIELHEITYCPGCGEARENIYHNHFQ